MAGYCGGEARCRAASRIAELTCIHNETSSSSQETGGDRRAFFATPSARKKSRRVAGPPVRNVRVWQWTVFRIDWGRWFEIRASSSYARLVVLRHPPVELANAVAGDYGWMTQYY